MKQKHFALWILILYPLLINAQSFQLIETGLFEPQNKKILLFKNTEDKKLLVFKTDVQVNTDGAPNSYHPVDVHGDSLAINSVGNAISVRKNNVVVPYKELISVFRQWRDSNYSVVPKDYAITWENVFATSKNGKPCIVDSGKYAGFLVSQTTLKNIQNGVRCDPANEINSNEIPGFVIPGDTTKFLGVNGARVGDLVMAYNPKTDKLVYAVVYDTGPKNKLGEGSVKMNMLLKGKVNLPKNIKDSYALVLDNAIISIIPQTRLYQRQRPFSLENIKTRIENWLKESGFKDEQSFKNFLKSNVK